MISQILLMVRLIATIQVIPSGNCAVRIVGKKLDYQHITSIPNNQLFSMIYYEKKLRGLSEKVERPQEYTHVE